MAVRLDDIRLLLDVNETYARECLEYVDQSAPVTNIGQLMEQIRLANIRYMQACHAAVKDK